MRGAKKVSGRTRLIDILYTRSHPGMSTLDTMYINHSHVFFIFIKLFAFITMHVLNEFN